MSDLCASPSSSPGRWKSLAQTVLFLGSVLLGAARSSQAATITVTRADDAFGTGDGVTLREALLAANSNASVDGSVAGSGADTIVFDPVVFATPQTLTLTGGWLPISSDVTINGPGAAKLTISGRYANRIFDINSGATATISGLTLTKGSGNTGNGGGAIQNRGTLILNDSVISGNAATAGFRGGGGILNVAGANATIQRTVIKNNAGVYGGGLANYGAAALTDCTIAANSTIQVGGFSSGGGIYLGPVGTLTMSRCTVVGNSAGDAGALSSGFGGGVDVRGTATLENCTISGNSVFGGKGNFGGGGISHLRYGSLTLRHCTITGNQDMTGAGGGGLREYGTYALPAAVTTIVSTIIADNATITDANGADLRTTSTDPVPPQVLATNSLFGILTTEAVLFSDNVNIKGTQGAPVDPLLLPLANNGGLTETHALRAGSRAIDAGFSPATPATDQRGVPRSMGATPDIGALETFAGPQTFIVDEKTDENDGNFSPGNLSLREAVLLSNGNPGADTVTFAAAVRGTIVVGSEIPISDDATIQGPGSAALTISGNNATRILNINDNAPSLVDVAISGLTFANGRAAAGAGGISNNENLELSDVVVSQCAATSGNGGGILAVGGGQVTLTDSLITHCSVAANSKGGGIYAGFGGTLILNHCRLDTNTSGGRGGGLSTFYSTVSISDCVISGNFGSNRGAGAFLYQSDSTIENTSITGNIAGDRGGGLFLYAGSSSIYACSIEGNTAGGFGGGGIFVYKGSPTIENTTISGNNAIGRGGGLFLFQTGIDIQNCTLSGNQANARGSNIYMDDASTAAVIENSTITGATGSHGIDQQAGTLTLKSVIVAGNFPYDVNGAVAASSDHNLIGVDGGLSGISNGDAYGNLIGTVAAPLDAKLRPLADNGGPTKTHALVAGSPALDAGSNASNLPTDQRGVGFDRMRNGHTDIGAVQATPPTDFDLTSNTVLENSPIGTPIGNFSSSDVNIDQAQVFEMVAGDGDANNPSFQIVGNELRTAAVLDYEFQSSYSIRVRVTDFNGFSFEKIVEIDLIDVNEPPSIVSVSSSVTDLTVQFSVFASDPDGDDLDYNWDFGDGTSDTDDAPQHDFPAAGIYQVTLTVSDGQGLTATRILFVKVTEPPANSGLSPDVDADGDGFDDFIEQALGSQPDDGASTPFNLPRPALADGLAVKRLTLKTRRVDLIGSVPLTRSIKTDGQTIIAGIGGLVRSFVADKHGLARSGVADLFRFSTFRKGRLNFRVSLRNGDYSDIDRTNGVQIVLFFNNTRYETTVFMK